MEVAELKQKIKNNALDAFYIFTGEEYYVQRKYIEQIAHVRNQQIKFVDDSYSLLTHLRGKSLFAMQNCFVLRDDKEFIQTEKLQKLVMERIGKNTLILVLSTVDKRLSFYKKYSAQIVDFKPLTERILLKYIKQSIDLSDTNCKILADLCGNNLGQILLEVDKISRCGEDVNQIFRKFLEDGTIAIPPSDAIFGLVDAILDRQLIRALELYEDCVEIGESNLAILQVLYNNTKQLLQVQSYSGPDIADATGLTTWQIKCAKNRGHKYEIWELVDLMRNIRNCEVGIKRGFIEDEFVIPYLISFIDD